ncbi:hypothetical protein FJR38_01405 [Anabaena sp. UHCC 0253]|nr:hypothetical protein [Anabaena sp. UHCC 0253]
MQIEKTGEIILTNYQSPITNYQPFGYAQGKSPITNYQSPITHFPKMMKCFPMYYLHDFEMLKATIND